MAATDRGGPAPRWSRVLLAVVLLVGALEVTCRLVVRQVFGAPFRSFDAYSFSGYGLYRQNADYTHPQFVHNSAGFRNRREFSVDKPPGTFRVMCIGASVLYSGSAPTHAGTSLRVATDETITAYLEPLLGDLPELDGLEVEVINAAVNRHYLRQTISYYIAELAPYDPDLVLVFGTHNDSARVEQADAVSTLFYDRAAPTPEEARLETLANEASLAALAEKTVRVSVNSSALAATTYRVLDRLLKRISISIDAFRRPGPPLLNELASPAEMERNLRYYLAGLEALLTYIEVQGARPVVFWEYLLMVVEDVKPLSPHERRLLDFLERRAGSLTDEHKRLKLEVRDRVAARLEQRGVPLIDIEDDLRGYSGNLFNDYLHYDATGNRWAAGIIARELRPVIAEIVAARGP